LSDQTVPQKNQLKTQSASIFKKISKLKKWRKITKNWWNI